MFSCKDVTEHASEYLSKEMPLWDRMQYRLHLFICHNCRNFLRQFRATIGALRAGTSPIDPTLVENQVAVLLRARREDQPHQ